ncbi:hypothetical protein C3Y87_15740 [Carbonactinospora thermoautotrophica]|uniref:rod shape-determining protein n=1 Tax=Carbonactinospora thermoautotrophica TaxID=1469144 RepID=UPI002270E94F|nr:rod shape-determining protein [Carbonactinospora thermoautotrophica]MCX9192840.1 hypothetical protein [Carbonactinospora thermoautotrophica]
MVISDMPRDPGDDGPQLRWSLRPAIAIDLGSARTRAWTPGRGMFVDVPTRVPDLADSPGPVRRGRIVDADGCVRMLRALLRRCAPPWRPRPVLVLCRPVLDEAADRARVHLVLKEALAPRIALFIDSVKAAAIGAGADLADPRPLLVVDLGAELTEVAVLAEGAVVAARRAEMGVRDLGDAVTTATIARTTGTLVGEMLREASGPEVVDALGRGALLVGAGALLPEFVQDLAAALDTPVRAAPAPRTAALRGAAVAVMAARRHPMVAATG